MTNPVVKQCVCSTVDHFDVILILSGHRAVQVGAGNKVPTFSHGLCFTK